MCNFTCFELFKMNNKGIERLLEARKLDPRRHGDVAMPLALSNAGEASGCR
jgi:hypothetical protein